MVYQIEDKTKTLKLFGNIYGKVCLPYKMEIEKSINIDSEIDLFLATKYFTK